MQKHKIYLTRVYEVTVEAKTSQAATDAAEFYIGLPHVEFAPNPSICKNLEVAVKSIEIGECKINDAVLAEYNVCPRCGEDAELEPGDVCEDCLTSVCVEIEQGRRAAQP